jgi:glycine/D-amino acid oxidase-like deaminating enzyme
VLGAGIVGLACAREILHQQPDSRVTLLEAGPGVCSGATGAGQGYLWLVHRSPEDEAMWQLAARGQQLWAQEREQALRCGLCAGLA